MENSQDQPLPPGVHSWPNYSSNSGQTLQYQFYPNPPPPHTPGGNSINTPYYNNFQQGTLSQSGQALITPSNHFDGGHHNAENTTTSAAHHQESGVNFTWKVDEAAANPSYTSTNCSVVQLNNECNSDAAAQDAVLREQVCIPYVYVFFIFHCFSLNHSDCFGFVFTDRKLPRKIS